MSPLVYFLISLSVLMFMIYGSNVAVHRLTIKEKKMTNFVICGCLIVAYIMWGIFFLANLNPVEPPKFKDE